MLDQKHCVPCEGGVLPLTSEEIQPFMKQVNGWIAISNNMAIEKQFVFKNFKEALAFVNAAGAIAEEEGHHPDLHLQNWNKVTVTLSTHAIGGLSENDFILAAKIDKISL
jgi:4a-hydroxytetrahydrobiopterin dehydratase